MFEGVVGESGAGGGCHVPDDDFDGVWERLLAGADADLDEVPDGLPGEWDEVSSVEPVLAYGRCAPSGWLALDLDSATADPARLADDTLIEAMMMTLAEIPQSRSAKFPTLGTKGMVGL